MIATNQFRKGLKIELDGEPFIVADFQHVKPGKGGAFVRTRLKSLVTGNVLDRTFRSGDKVKRPDFEEKEMQYLYSDENGFNFMDTNTYDQICIPGDELGDSKGFLSEQLSVTVQMFNGRPIGMELPIFVELQITRSDPGVKGDTASGATKPAELETGAVIQVPLFVEEGQVVKIDTRTGEYIERVR
ncbi:MAG TPA: elongation factor P [Proteobacteria bacterium]|nr:elongation factor P [bacterium BMS3Abin14]HDL52544.1 elongation factor P [Pseudomonadota bacterium]